MASQFPSDPTSEELLRVFTDELRRSPKNLDRYLARQYAQSGYDYERAPLESMTTGSPALNAVRQLLPENVGSTQWGQNLVGALPENAPTWLKEGVQSVGLGGFSREEIETLQRARIEDPEVRRYTTEVGQVRGPDGQDVAIGSGNYRTKAAQAAGIASADVISDGVRNIWWFLNAPQALSYLAMQQGMHQASEKAKDVTPVIGAVSGKGVPLIRNRNLRMAAAVPAWVAMSMGIGNFARTPGYKAALPSEADPTQSTDPIGEGINRYFLGKTGALLPYDEFVKERPDVSKSEYDAYKSYLFGNASPIKATLDGIHGPEVTFMGKSMPVATAILPAIAAVVGARRGVARSAKRLAGQLDSDGRNRFQQEQALRDAHADLLEQERESLYKKDAKPPSQDEIEAAYTAYRNVSDSNDAEVLKSVLANSSTALAGTALAGYTLESMRRALKGRAPIEPDEEQVIQP